VTINLRVAVSTGMGAVVAGPTIFSTGTAPYVVLTVIASLATSMSSVATVVAVTVVASVVIIINIIASVALTL